MAEKAKKKAWWQKLIIALAIAAIVVAVFFGAVIGYFKLPVSGYYKASEKAFEIPGLSDGFIAQGISYDDREDTFFITGYMKDKSASPVYLVKKSDGKKECCCHGEHCHCEHDGDECECGCHNESGCECGTGCHCCHHNKES